MRQWRSGSGEKAWLAALIETMEEVSRPELRGTRCAPSLMAAVESHLAHPGMRSSSYFSLRN